MSRFLVRLIGVGLGMVSSAASMLPNVAWADGTAEALVVAEEPTPVATSPAAPVAPPPANVVAVAPRPFVPPAPVETEPSFYGWQNIVVGHVSIGAAVLIGVLGDGSSGTGEAGGLIGLGYVLGGPIIHAVHGDGWRAIGAVGILAGIPATLGLTGFVIDEACGEGASCTGSTWAYGLLAGLVLAPIVDGVALGWEEVPVRAGDTKLGASALVPVLDVSLERGAESVSVGVGGTF